METIGNSFLKDLFMSNSIDKEFLDKNFSELSRFAEYYEIPLHFWHCMDNKCCFANSYSKLADENKVVIERFEREIERISKMLKINDVSYCILVGIPFAKRYFPSEYMRIQEDIDFFISTSDYEKVTVLMKDSGYDTIGEPPSKNRKHQVFINKGFKQHESSLSGRNIIKFYTSLTQEKYFKTKFEDFQSSIVSYGDFLVLDDTAALVQLIIHAHLYDMHPKVLGDIYMICKNAKIDWNKFWYMAEKVNTIFLSAVLLSMMKCSFLVGNISIPACLLTENVLIYEKKLSSQEWWSRTFPKLSSEELTYHRAYLSGKKEYEQVYSDDVNNNMCRRVGKQTEIFEFID